MPSWTPAAPRPAIALPMLKATEFGAAPQTAEPISNRTTDARKMALTLKKVYIFPKMSKEVQLVSM